LTFFANIPEYSMRISLAQFVDMDDISLLMQSPSARMFQVLSCLITYLVTVCARARLVQGLFNYFQIADVVSGPVKQFLLQGFLFQYLVWLITMGSKQKEPVRVDIRQ
jgi:hypothetical protein